MENCSLNVRIVNNKHWYLIAYTGYYILFLKLWKQIQGSGLNRHKVIYTNLYIISNKQIKSRVLKAI